MTRLFSNIFLSCVLLNSIGCSTQTTQTKRSLTIGAYTTPRDAYDKEIIPEFQDYWFKQTGEEIVIDTSYQGSGSQSRAVIGGFEADIVALSLEPDVTRIADAGLITHDWKNDSYHGMVTASIAVLAVRKGNPKGIHDWMDLTREDVEVLTPNPKTSGGAMWNIAAVYGAATRGKIEGITDTIDFVSKILHQVKIMDKGARESVLTFEQGVGDVAITYENEVLTARLTGKNYEYVVPKSTILIVNPIAIVDVNVEKHNNRDVAEAFVKFVRTPDIQTKFAKYGYRPVIQLPENPFQDPEDLFKIDDLGGWPKVTQELFSPGAFFDKALEKAREN